MARRENIPRRIQGTGFGNRRGRKGETAAGSLASSRPDQLLSFGSEFEVCNAVLLPAILVVLGAERTVFTVRNGCDAICRDSEVDQEVLGRVGAPVAQTEVVFLAAALVAVPFNRELDAGMSLQEVGVGSERLLSVRANVRLVEVKERILDVLPEFLLLVHLNRRWWRRGWRRRRRGHGNPCARGIGSARPGGGKRVGRRICR